MPLPVFVHSSYTLEPWNHTTPWLTGIGGSETSHIEMTARLAARGFSVHSYAPVPKAYKEPLSGVRWSPSDTINTKSKGIYIWYRDPAKFDLPKPPKSRWWFVAQDVDYEGQWTEERLSKVDRYLCLCKDHVSHTKSKYPSIRDKVFLSSNGIRSSHIRNLLASQKRNPNRLFFPSSPDRGLKLLMENWFRIREINKKAELHVAYGFNNMEAIVRAVGPEDWRYEYQKELLALARQPGITLTGRLNQSKVYAEWLQTQAWAHPTSFPETSCITCMEAQACGAWPITNDLWALRDNVKYGWMVDGVPQNSPLIRANWLHCLEEAFSCRKEKERKEMQEWALAYHDWENVVDQWEEWINEDSKCEKIAIK